MIILIITNHYAFMKNQKCVDYFNEKLENSNDYQIIFDKSYLVTSDYSVQLSKFLKKPVKCSGLWGWNKFFNLKQINLENNKTEVFFEGLFSPFQKETHSQLSDLGVSFYCYSAVIPNFFF